MKFAQTIVSAVLCGFALMLATQASAQSTKPGYATIVRIQGEARYSPGNNVWHPLTVGQTLGPGDVIQTATDSKVDLVLGDKISQHIATNPSRVGLAADSNVRGMTSFKAEAAQNVIQMRGGTVLAIDKLMISATGIDAVSDTELDLRQGTIFGNVKKLSAASQYLIKTPNGIAGVRGTTFIMSANGDITVISGSMVLSVVGANGQTTTVVLGPGEQYNPITGQTTQLTPGELTLLEQTAVETITVTEGVISFANDKTTIYISPTTGAQ
jgi:FecR protein